MGPERNREELLEEARRYDVRTLNETEVSLRGKRLDRIPEFIFSMPKLKTLILSDNNISTLPGDIGKLKSLKRLIIDVNKLTALPAAIGKLTNLEELGLDNNQLASLPESIGNLTSLEGLYVSDNKLTSLPESLGNLGNLSTFIVNSNNLTTLPKSLGNLERLKILFLVNNRLTHLPKSIGNLRSLNLLFLTGNRLESLPESMKTLPSSVHISYNCNMYTRNTFIRLPLPMFTRDRTFRVNNDTNVMNNSFMNARLNNIPPNRRAFVNKKSDVKENGSLRRVYDVNGLRRYIQGKTTGRLHGGTFTNSNIILLKNVPHVVNKSAYMRNIRNRFANTSLNNLAGTIQATKNNLPGNVTKTDVNKLVNGMKNDVRQRIANRLRNTPAGDRKRLLSTYRSMGLINNTIL